ncbi:glycoside hydrolase family 9 protein [Aliiglaciecola sp. LCG003]|uniref:glycoside hydrolase family 9 protein n=1 Tax=Aliiglaciecola sp. LCG003 TaxID=3053655 RepID=UPI0025732C92|nr:glycoside hydrolase family 9 protein [Aliiglaciecola sp. LCG003]WJG09199.1 glycoside hydrolase family 9 protein [Aliiglaciecola sp. LCG003]
MKLRLLILLSSMLITSVSYSAENSPLKMTEKEYLSQPGLDVLVFNNWYNGLFSDSKISGIELVHHGVRTVTNGDVRLNDTPEQWDAIPAFIKREVHSSDNSIEAFLHYPEHKFNYSIKVTPTAQGVDITVNLPQPLPQALSGKAGLNLEFLPSTYFEKSFIVDQSPGHFPLYPTGIKEVNGQTTAPPLAAGQHLVLAPEDEKHRVSISTKSGQIALFDGRSKAQNGWFVVRGLLPEGKSGEVLKWSLSASTVQEWQRSPVIGHSQVGYHPKQQKVAVIELDQHAKFDHLAELIRVNSDGSQQVVQSAKPELWGNYTRYQYGRFDFSSVTESGVYLLRYGDTTTAAFSISAEVYAQAWHPTLDHYFPVQMDHMLINEAYRVWHGASHLDDALQAPVDIEHFDLYAQGPTTDTQYQPGEHIPGLNIGGWYDAGDYDIRTQTQYQTVQNLVAVWDNFAPKRDTTLVDYDAKYVDIHVPDGKPDLLQQIEHGSLALLAQYRAVGHAIPGIIVPDISQYTHLGDGLTMTDNLIYSDKMKVNQSDGIRSGKFDDRWAFTSKSSALDYGSMAALAAASRALKGYNDALAKEALDTALQAWQTEQDTGPLVFRHGNTTGGRLQAEKLKAAVELLVTTGEPRFAQAVTSLLPEISEHFSQSAVMALRALPFMEKSYRATLRKLAEQYRQQYGEITSNNPYGVLITEGGWAGNGTILNMAMTNYYLHQAYPDLFEAELVFQALHYLYGTHPDSDISFVSNVGTVSKKVAYGMNRADFSFISGAVVPGVLILKPDLPENKEDWPFLWGQNEYVINVGASYIFVASAVQQLLQQSK